MSVISEILPEQDAYRAQVGAGMRLCLTDTDQPTLLAWAAQRLQLSTGRWPMQARALGVFDIKADRLRAVVVIVRVYESYCDVHVATDESAAWASRNIISGLAGYIFWLLRVARMQCIIGADNAKGVKILRHLGFNEIGTVPGGMDNGQDGIMFSMRKRDCRWLNLKGETHG
ncbi:hypothetical protein DL1_08455 [Thioclava dalianensis]|uniref:N-acetyltransferase domain-containing protein n=1 Tax=Thioclava dalianensis TaxID=1185766 RepID=A0A074TIJ1_9RHOB|nr:hypothetical protein DL1_08455 [Thioclava dalianensis]SFN50365.1 hypothetical protein SAMN05216224_10697 [Thioclava dalianensis]